MNHTLAIAGDRLFNDYKFFSKVVSDHIERLGADLIEIITGDCSGTDAMALDWAMTNGYIYTVYCASRYNWIRLDRDGINAVLCSDWKIDGNAAGPKRNRLLVEDADSVLLFDGGGPGSKSVRQLAAEYKRPVELWQIQPWECAGGHVRSLPVVTGT